MKKLLCAIAVMLASLPVSAFIVDGIEYEVYNEEAKTAYVSKPNGCCFVEECSFELFDCLPWRNMGDYSGAYSGDIIIPEKVTFEGNEYTVVRIGAGAFSNCKNLTSVVMPNTVTDVLEGAFYDCPNLKSITFSNNTRGIGYMTLRECPSLTKLDFSGIQDYLQLELTTLTSLREVTLPPNAIIYSVFGECKDCIFKITNPYPPVLSVNFDLPEGCTLYAPYDPYNEGSIVYSLIPMWHGTKAFTYVRPLDELGSVDKVIAEGGHYHLEGNRLTTAEERLEVYDMEGRLRHVLTKGRTVALVTGAYLLRGEGFAEKIVVQ